MLVERWRYPWRMFTDKGTLYCSAAANAGFDLCLYLIAKFIGREAALDCARAVVIDLGRFSQSPYEVPSFEQTHFDETILRVQRHIDQAYAEPWTITKLAHTARLSRRTFERRFKAATGTISSTVHPARPRRGGATPNRIQQHGFRPDYLPSWLRGPFDISGCCSRGSLGFPQAATAPASGCRCRRFLASIRCRSP